MSDGIFKAEPFFGGIDGAPSGDPRWIVKNPDGMIIVNTVGGNDKENAKLIANACNRSVEDYEPVRVGCTIMVVRDGKVLLGERGDACETAVGCLPRRQNGLWRNS